LRHLRETYYAPALFYRKRKSEWLREGAKDLLERAHEKVEALLARETPVFLTADQLAAMDEIIVEACAELADGWDSRPYLPRE